MLGKNSWLFYIEYNICIYYRGCWLQIDWSADMFLIISEWTKRLSVVFNLIHDLEFIGIDLDPDSDSAAIVAWNLVLLLFLKMWHLHEQQNVDFFFLQ